MSPRPPEPRSPQPGEPHPEETRRDDRLGAALSDLPVPDHGPTFWADLTDRLSEPTATPQPIRAEGETTVPSQTGSATDVGPDPISNPNPLPAETVSLEDRRARRAARRGGRLSRSLGAAVAAVALVVAVAGAVSVIRDDNGTDRDVRAADRPAATGQAPGPTPSATAPAAAAPVPAELSATYDGIEGWDGPEGCCSTYRFTVASDGSFRWTSTDGGADMAYDATTGRHVELVTRGAGASKERPNAFVSTGVPAGGPDRRVARPDPLDPMADFVTALARAGDPRISTRTVAGRAAWHYDGPTVQDRLGGDGAPNHAVADVDQASGVLLELTRRVGDLVVTRFTASDVAIGDQIDRSRYQLDPPAGSKTTTVSLGFVTRTLDEASRISYGPLLVPSRVPTGFTLESVSLDRDVPSPTGPEGMNPPAKEILAMTWRNGASWFTVTLRPSGGEQWDDPFGAEGMVPDAQRVHLELAGRPPLDGEVIVDAPLVPHLWGLTANVVVTVSGDLSRTELETVAGSLRPHES
jgi:hypothetical protein